MRRNSTIISKKRKLDCGCFDYAFSKNRCKRHATIESTNKRIEKFEEKELDEGLQNLIQDLDAIFSRYIRLKYSDEKGLVKCFTCPKVLPISEIQNGHFIHRQDMGTRFLEDNCRPQCPKCNSKHNDDPSIFKNKLEQDKKGITQWLEEQSREIIKPTRDELKQMITDYRYRVKILEKKIKKHS
jgi:hypothetical protein